MHHSMVRRLGVVLLLVVGAGSSQAADDLLRTNNGTPLQLLTRAECLLREKANPASPGTTVPAFELYFALPPKPGTPVSVSPTEVEPARFAAPGAMFATCLHTARSAFDPTSTTAKFLRMR